MRNFARIGSLLGVVAWMLAAACVSQAGSADPSAGGGSIEQALEDGLYVQERTATRIAGIYRRDGREVAFSSEQLSSTAITADLVFETGLTIRTEADAEAGGAGTLSLTVPGHQLIEEEHYLLVSLAEALVDLMPYPTEPGDETALPQESLLRGMSSLLSEAPGNLVDDTIVVDLGDVKVVEGNEDGSPAESPSAAQQPSAAAPLNPAPPLPYCQLATGCNCDSDDDLVTKLSFCCNRVTTTSHQHDAVEGDYCELNAWSDLRLACVEFGFNASNGCKGRCGPGCKAPPYYSLDCLDHDWCGRIEGEEGILTWSPVAFNCGDEWFHAVDDVAYVTALHIGCGFWTRWRWGCIATTGCVN